MISQKTELMHAHGYISGLARCSKDDPTPYGDGTVLDRSLPPCRRI